MAVDILQTYPADAVAPNGTLTFPYPSGRSATDYARTGAELTSSATQGYHKQGAGFSVAFGGSGATVTWLGAGSLPARRKVSLQLTLRDRLDGDDVVDGTGSSVPAPLGEVLGNVRPRPSLDRYGPGRPFYTAHRCNGQIQPEYTLGSYDR